MKKKGQHRKGKEYRKENTEKNVKRITTLTRKGCKISSSYNGKEKKEALQKLQQLIGPHQVELSRLAMYFSRQQLSKSRQYTYSR